MSKKHQPTYDLGKQCSKETLVEVLALITENSLIIPNHVSGLLIACERVHLVEEIDKVKAKLAPFIGRESLKAAETKIAKRLLNKGNALQRRFDKISALVTK